MIPLSVLQMPGLMAELNLECLAPGQGTLRHGVPNKREPGASIMGPLNDLVAERLPRVELAEVLIEVDSWTGFTQFFRHAGGARSRNPDLGRHVYAAILAQACNFGLTTRADLADLTYRQLAGTTDWYLREETLKAAFSALVDFPHQLPLAEAWGGGTLSSSDGQRFPVRGSAENAAALPEYFGLGRGLTFYTWTSDQYSQYGSKVISSTVRDATHVLDEILEHTTDTAGYTEIVFALFHLLGLQFAPRIRDLGAQRWYRLDAPPRKRRGRGSAEGIGSEQDPTRQLGRTSPGGRLTQVGLGERIAPDFEAPDWRKRERLVPSPPRSRAPRQDPVHPKVD